ncbi:hypothetical protein IJG73_01790, partial [Candidatus Saccharibacteria bacterium]|nr:hypothetical protein [Candidatus Saccharibacteria bacterium]
MIITDNFNHRRILRTVTIELSEPENIKQNKVASILYHYADLHRGLFPFVQEMILHQDISIYPLQKPFHDQSLVKFYAIKAALTEPIARQFANG